MTPEEEEYEIARLERELSNLEYEETRLRNELAYAQEQNKILTVDRNECQSDVHLASQSVSSLTGRVVPPVKREGGRLEIHGGLTKDSVKALDELDAAYAGFKSQSTAVKKLSNLTSKYYTYFDNYNDLRNITLGYVVGVDSEMWTTDTPRKTVEKAYLANTPYWLASAIMAVMLWANDEQDAAQRAMSAAMNLDLRKSTLFFLLINLRFERVDAAKEWMELYFDLLDEDDIGNEMQYVMQAFLCGALGHDLEFQQKYVNRIQVMFDSAKKRKPGFADVLKKNVHHYYDTVSHFTSQEYVMMGRGVTEYAEMRSLLSEAEKNEIFLKHYEDIYKPQSEPNDQSLSRRIEDTLVALISAHDDKEQELLDEMRYYDNIVKAKGDEALAKKAFNAQQMLDKQKTDIGVFFVELALTTSREVSPAVRKFALGFVRQYCHDATIEYANAYRKDEKENYSISFDGWQCSTNENGFDDVQPSLVAHYKKMINQKIKKDPAVKTSKIVLFASLGCMIILTIILGFLFERMDTGQHVLSIIFDLILLGIFVGSICSISYQIHRIREMNQSVIENGVDYLKQVLEEMAQWRKRYKEMDAVNKKVLTLLE